MKHRNHFQTKELLVGQCDELKHAAKSAWGNLLPRIKIPNHGDSYRNDWISPVKINRTMVNVTSP